MHDTPQRIAAAAGIAIVLCLAALPDARAADFAAAQAVFVKHCVACHNAEDKDGDLDLETRVGLGAAIGAGDSDVIIPGRSADSPLVLVIERKLRPFMPPGSRPRPDDAEIAALKAWIDAGAGVPATAAAPVLATPDIPPVAPPRRAARAVAWSPDGSSIAIARHRRVEIVDAATRGLERVLEGHGGSVTALVFTSDGERVIAACGEPGLEGEARLWSWRDGAFLRAFSGAHTDCLYAVAVTRDGAVLATAGYDQRVVLWNAATGEVLRALAGHNGAVFSVAFRGDGKVLASASADRTAKLWSVDTGERLDTLSQATRGLNAVAFSPDGERLAAAGADNRIRVFRVSESAAEGTNALLVSRFAHEGEILALAFSPDGRRFASAASDATVRLWDGADVGELRLLESQPDWPTSLAFDRGGARLAVSRMDGSIGVYDTDSGRAIRVARAPLAPARAVLVAVPVAVAEERPAPEVERVWPGGARAGGVARIELRGKHLDGIEAIEISGDGVAARLAPGAPAAAESVWIDVTAAPDAALGARELRARGAAGAAGAGKPARLLIESAEQVTAAAAAHELRAPPLGVWGLLDRAGTSDRIPFEARAGQRLVIDLAARRLGSKADLVADVIDDRGLVLATFGSFDGDPDPLGLFVAPAGGRYAVEVRDEALGASAEHFYQLTIGEIAYVTGVFPLGVAASRATRVALAGWNLPEDAAATVTAGGSGEVAVPIDPRRFRSRREFRVAVSAASVVESEPNEEPTQATAMAAPGFAEGRIERAAGAAPGDADLFRFAARAGEAWIIETHASRRGAPADTRIEVLWPDGRPVERVLLQAVRDSSVTFRPIDSSSNDVRLTNWEEMDLDQYLWFEGEVARILRMPQGPDSGFQLYHRGGRRVSFFDTSATAHALEAPVYVVEAHPPGTRLASTGLPILPLHYANDDDGLREIGRDSRLAFTAPADGDYLVCVTDARGFGGDRFAYRLELRRPAPGFRGRIAGGAIAVAPGSGKSFTFAIDRVDGFEGAVRLDIEGLPAGLAVSTPIVIQEGHGEARGTVWAAAGGAPLAADALAGIRARATALVGGRETEQDIAPFPAIRIDGTARVKVDLRASDGAAGAPGRPVEIAIAPGERLPALVRIERQGFDGPVTFDVENLPHGVIVDDIGLNGILIPPGETERRIFLLCAAWVPETSRLCHARSREEDGQTSLPVLLHVRRSAD